MNGKFELEMVHKLDKELTELGYKTFNPTAVELTKICIEQNKTPEEVLAIFMKVQQALLK